MDVIYPHLKSEWGCNELRYSLRSIGMYADYDNVFVVGYNPEWLTGVKHIPFNTLDRGDTIDRVEAGLKQSTAGEVLIIYDDVYLLEPLEKVHYYEGTLKNRMVRMAKNRQEAFNRVVPVVGDDALNFSLHQPLIADRLEFLSFINLVNGRPFPYENLYCNLTTKYPKKTGVDCKFYKNVYEKQLRRMPFFSTGAESDDLLPLMLKLYPEKSIFE